MDQIQLPPPGEPDAGNPLTFDDPLVAGAFLGTLTRLREEGRDDLRSIRTVRVDRTDMMGPVLLTFNRALPWSAYAAVMKSIQQELGEAG